MYDGVSEGGEGGVWVALWYEGGVCGGWEGGGDGGGEGGDGSWWLRVGTSAFLRLRRGWVSCDDYRGYSAGFGTW